MKRLMTAITLVAIAAVSKGQAHEFWIDPVAFRVTPGAALVADIRVGEDFRGAPLSYLPRNFERFEVIMGSAALPVEGRFGDIPALDMAEMPEGLAIIVHQTTETRLTWTSWVRFLGFAEHKDLGDVTAMQARRGLDQEDVREGYTRFAKALVAVGNGAGADARVGLRTELVALANPYTDDVSAGLPVQLWLDDAPRAEEQVELFEEAPDGSVTITLHRTDSRGIAMLPVRPGHIYMADAVALEPAVPQLADDPEWITLWANLTFAVP